MLIDEPSVMRPDHILQIVGGGDAVKHLQTGCYEILHFGSSHFLKDRGFTDALTSDRKTWEPLLSVGCYGVCDDLANLLQKCPELESDPTRQFLVTLTRIDKSDQPESGGWRWHKWGDYIGSQEPTTEYIADEPKIETVFCYHIYEKKREPGTGDAV